MDPRRPFDPATGEYLDDPRRPTASSTAPPPPPALGSPLTPPNPAGAEDPTAPKKSAGAVVFHVLLAIDLALLLAGLVYSLWAGYMLYFQPDSQTAHDLDKAFSTPSTSGLWLQVGQNLLLFGLIPFLWAWGTRVGGLQGALAWFKLHTPGRSIGRGLLVGTGLVVLLLVGGYIQYGLEHGFTAEPDANLTHETDPVQQGLLDSIDWPLAIALALTAGLCEELFFRGLLQRKLGWAGQGVLFGLFHATGGNVVQVVIVTGIGLLFGYLVARRNVSLWLVMAAHATYDFLQLAAALSQDSL